jgi:hypothetical protein
MTRAAWQWSGQALVFAALCSLVAFALLEYWFFQTSPRSIDPTLGAIYPMNWRKTTVYVTAAQHLETDALFWGGVLLFLAAVATNLRTKLFPDDIHEPD